MVGCVLHASAVGSVPPIGVTIMTVGGTGVLVTATGVFVADDGGGGLLSFVAVGGFDTGVGEADCGVGVREGIVNCPAGATAFKLLTCTAYRANAIITAKINFNLDIITGSSTPHYRYEIINSISVSKFVTKLTADPTTDVGVNVDETSIAFAGNSTMISIVCGRVPGCL